MVRVRRGCLSISVSTLPLFARAHSCAAANGESSALRFALALSQPPWQLCAGATRAARATAAFFRSVDARLPCCHHVRKAHKAARAPKGPKASSPRKKNAEATMPRSTTNSRPRTSSLMHARCVYRSGPLRLRTRHARRVPSSRELASARGGASKVACGKSASGCKHTRIRLRRLLERRICVQKHNPYEFVEGRDTAAFAFVITDAVLQTICCAVALGCDAAGCASIPDGGVPDLPDDAWGVCADSLLPHELCSLARASPRIEQSDHELPSLPLFASFYVDGTRGRGLVCCRRAGRHHCLRVR